MQDMHLPLYSNDELWRQLSGPNIGFYTYRTRGTIPDQAGLYAWLYPCKAWSDINYTIERAKHVFRYEPWSQMHNKKTYSTHIHWDELRFTFQHTERYNRDEKMEEKWQELSSAVDNETLKSLQQIIMLSSIFSKALYVGLTSRSLSVRYEEHVLGSKKDNTFHNRFSEHMKENGIDDLEVKDLVFAAIPVQLPSSVSSGNLEKLSVDVLEYVAKSVVGPVYGVK